MAVSTITATFTCNLEKVWETVTSLKNYGWRSDLDRIEVIDESHFVEYTREGYATNFTITKEEPYKRWEFDMENDNIKGHWSGSFLRNNDMTVINFSEDVTAKKLIMKPFVKAYLKKQQETYVEDLRKALTL